MGEILLVGRGEQHLGRAADPEPGQVGQRLVREQTSAEVRRGGADAIVEGCGHAKLRAHRAGLRDGTMGAMDRAFGKRTCLRTGGARAVSVALPKGAEDPIRRNGASPRTKREAAATTRKRLKPTAGGPARASAMGARSSRSSRNGSLRTRSARAPRSMNRRWLVPIVGTRTLFGDAIAILPEAAFAHLHDLAEDTRDASLIDGSAARLASGTVARLRESDLDAARAAPSPRAFRRPHGRPDRLPTARTGPRRRCRGPRAGIGLIGAQSLTVPALRARPAARRPIA